MNSKISILLMCLLLSSCFSSRKVAEQDKNTSDIQNSPCEALQPFSSLFIGKAKAEVKLDGETYDAKVNLYYIPDSLIFLTAANTGFEIVRAALTPDSLIFINRIERVVYTYKENELGYKAPVTFRDLEYLLNKTLACRELGGSSQKSEELVIDRSIPNITRKITMDSKDLKMNSYEFFHKKTGEYIVGEKRGEDSLFVYSNYLFDDVEIISIGGEHIFNEKIKVDVSFNKNKYLLISGQ